MRLIKLKLKNIASLKGDHLIEFDQISQSSSLFAITGETGSGKSTILNAIAMALYGRVYKTTLTQADIVTLGEREGQIQLIFSIKGEFYLADWRGRIRKPNGELLKKPTLDRVIQKISSDSFESEKTPEAYQAEDLLGLNFDQFCKCIILNQGEFAKFLSSSFTERKAILEKLYPGEDIENLSRYLKLELDQASSKINIVNTQLETLKIDPEEGEVLLMQKEKMAKELDLKNLWEKRYASLKRLFESLEIYYKSFQENLNRKSRLEGEIKETTHLFNLSMSESENKQKIVEKLSQSSETMVPVLQELIKKEELEKFLKEQILVLKASIEKLNQKKDLNKKQYDETWTNKQEWQNAYNKTLESFKFDPEFLLSFKTELETFADNMAKIEKLEIEKKSIEEKFNDLEARGKDIKSAILKLEEDSKDGHLQKEKLKELKEERTRLQERINTREFHKKSKNDFLARKKDLSEEMLTIDKQINEILLKRQENATLLSALEVSLSLHEYNLSLKRCVDHAKAQDIDHCPICQSTLKENFWDNLKVSFSESNIEQMALKHQKIVEETNELKNKEIFLLSKSQEIKSNFEKIELELSVLEQELNQALPDIKKLEEEIEKTETKLIAHEHQQKELTRLNSEITLIRNQYLQTKESLGKIENTLNPIFEENKKLLPKFNHTYPQIETKLSELKIDLRSLVQLTNEKKQGETLEQKLTHLEENLKSTSSNLAEINEQVKKHEEDRDKLLNELLNKLHGKSAQEELNLIQTKLKEARSELQSAQTIQKSHEQSLSLKRGNFSSIEQLLKDYELKFIETLSNIKELIAVETPFLNDEIYNFEDKLKNISLTFNDSIELIIALKEFVHESLTEFEENINSLSTELGAVKEKISHWEKTQDKIKLLKLQFEEANAKSQRYKRLSTILGTDELRTFALSLVEENLILHTNEELANLCQSRYEIIHQSRRGITPEFYILDKFREGGIRKVSTLSGGETFMVSLAMALALAEMTRGQAEIDTLFIDEGFGTLDQESLEDVLDMLNQIQNRGLMIGIISHIKTLTSALGVNLVLNKSQDGTSKVSIQYN